MKQESSRSPYLATDGRLSDVIAALQALGSYDWATRKIERWREGLGEPISAANWSQVFRQHPEFFRLNDEDEATLRWRHAYDRVYAPNFEPKRELSAQELSRLTPDQKRKELSRKPLTSDQIQALVATAVELHSRAIAHKEKSRWWVAVATQASVALIGLAGVALGAWLKTS